ncbi:MAG: 50S ribosomal protein L24 [Clostridia bacterium]|jgi:large subunit ribosomal protein L24|nr:50S ribosomal protein L24 [Clostridia bacterium]MDD4275570.1 50S ribosomal protein L24 [Clostridia bacterium]
MSKLKIKKGDTVLVIAGKDKGKTAKITSAQPNTHKVIVAGVNMLTHFKKARSAKDQDAGIKKAEGAIDISNVMIVCSSCKKATRVAYRIDGKNKVRICKHCGASLESKVTKAKVESKKAKVAKETIKEEKAIEQVVTEKPKRTRTKKTTEEIK